MNTDLAALVEQARSDDVALEKQHAAFAELVRRFDEAAFTWALQRLGDPDDARDATQEAFLDAWLKLRRLREPAAFGAWLKRIVLTRCNRRLRKRTELTDAVGEQAQHIPDPRDHQRLLAAAMARLPEPESRVLVLFYFLGRTLDEIAAILGIARGTAGKRLHDARLAIRRHLPSSVRGEFQRLRPSASFMQKVREGLFDEYLGEYRFEARPELVVQIVREGSSLVSYGGGQRSVLASIRDETLATTAYDGEGRFKRDRSGRVVQFVYYEFGARLGVATRVTTPAPLAAPAALPDTARRPSASPTESG